MVLNVNYSLSTHCNMSCPDCCAGVTSMAKNKRRFVSWDYIVNSAKYIQGLDINITGGEASIHPQFEKFIPKMRKLFNAPLFTTWTNGTTLKKKAETFKHFDIIYISHYTKDSFEGSPDNTEDIEFIKNYLKDTDIRADKVIHQQPNDNSGMCQRAAINGGTVEFVDGMIYPCCTSSGLPTKINVPLNKDWKENILTIKPPCKECVFAI
jgi:organic radical activating enzyme